MKRAPNFIFAIIIACTFAAGSVSAASSRENKRLQEGKITKNEAEHLVLRKFPGATIKKCELTRRTDHSIWVLEVIKAGAKDATRLEVDGRSGKILP